MNFKDANKLLGLTHLDALITPDNLDQFIPQLQAYVKDHLDIGVGQSFYPFTFNEHSIFNEDSVLKTSAGTFILIDFNLVKNLPEIPPRLNIHFSAFFEIDEDHEGFLVVEHYWKGSVFNNAEYAALTFSDNDRNKVLDLTESSMMRGFVGVVKQGMKHIWIGIDHVLFVLVLLLPAVMIRRGRKWEPVPAFKPSLIYVLKIISLFTIAHSITLTIAASGLFELQSRIVESIIAISIAVAALDIIFPIFKGRIGWVVFGFGLFHGFGFASVLGHMGILGEHMATSLFGFNLGVEIGQLVIILFAFPILFLVRNKPVYRGIVLKIGPALLIIVALYWFVKRAFEIEMSILSFL